MVDIRINPEKFQESITKELEVVKNRVRNLIGDAHWGKEGEYKEAILKNVIKRFLPSNLSIGTGFIVKSNERVNSSNEIEVSKQIDIIIYDNRIPVLFSEGDFIITSYRNVKAIIEVKTKICNSELNEIFKRSILNAKLVGNDSLFNGIFSFEYGNDTGSDTAMESLKENLISLGDNGKYINHISLGPYIFIKYWERGAHVPSYGCHSDFFGIYNFIMDRRRGKKISFSYFISNLLDFISEVDLSDRLWLLFPITGTGKEEFRIKTACLGNS